MTDKATQPAPPPLPPWKASFLSDKIIGKKKTDFRSWTPQLRIIFVLNFILLCETTSSAPSKRHFHTEPSQAFEREGKGSFRRERNAGVSLPPSLLKRPSRFAFRVSPFPFPFKRLPRRLPPPQAFLGELVFHPSQHLFVGRDEIHEKRALEKRLAPW